MELNISNQNLLIEGNNFNISNNDVGKGAIGEKSMHNII